MFMLPWALVVAASLCTAQTPPDARAFTSVAPTATVRVPAVDRQVLLQEDKRAGEARGEKSMERIGVFQSLAGAVRVEGLAPSHGAWTPQPDGSLVWALRVLAEKAVGQRIEFSALHMPPGGQVCVYSENDPSQCFGPYAAIPATESTLWAPAVFGESAVIVCRVPRGSDPAEVTLVLEQVGYLYRFLPESLSEKFAGTCNLDASCYPAWANTALAVGGLSIIGQTGILFCTCTLIADAQDCTEIPYVLTAHHCVSNQSGSYGAEYLDFYWRYQTPTCHGTPPSPSSVPRTTGGADYLAGMGGRGDTGGGNDFTFLRMRNLPPAGLAYARWSTTVPPVGTEVVCIHHPHGDYKRISFGTLTNTGNLYPNYFHEVTWHDGVTEPGSSGSPMFIAATQEVIGQLWGGDSACATPTAPDFYGRLDVSYPSISAWLSPGPATLGFSAGAYAVSEGQAQAAVVVQLSGPSAGGVTVQYETAAGTATANVDFTPVLGTLTFDRGVSIQSFHVPILPDTTHETAESIVVRLKSPNCPVLGLSEVALSILDDDTDTDGDGLSDYDEIHATFGFASDPNRPDSDGDSLTDFDEVMAMHGFRTDPNLRDTDGDSIDDGLELIFHLDPLNPYDGEEVPSVPIPWFK